MEKNMEKVLLFLKMEVNIKDYGKMTRKPEVLSIPISRLEKVLLELGICKIRVLFLR